jgi:hypothetical protein
MLIGTSGPLPQNHHRPSHGNAFIPVMPVRRRKNPAGAYAGTACLCEAGFTDGIVANQVFDWPQKREDGFEAKNHKSLHDCFDVVEFAALDAGFRRLRKSFAGLATIERERG